MSSAETPRFRCAIYAARPESCRSYPWRDAQVLFDECVFINGEVVEGFEETTARLGSAEAVAIACQRCGRCCFGWTHRDASLEPIVRCSHLVVSVSRDSADPTVRAMLAVDEEQDFG